jgi:uncharacterized protein
VNQAPARFPGRAPIEAYGNGGFRFAGMSHRGSILCLPSGVFAWSPSRPLDVTSIEPVLAEATQLSLLILGTGRTHQQLPAPVRRALVDAGLALETMDTGAACRTYNVLLAEGRSVGAALLAAD